MKTKSINGLHIEKMLRNGLANLCQHENELNNMNVFPVADGDTGTNMRITLESGINAAKTDRSACQYLKALSEGMLFGARGNSGVILSQLFKGIYVSLSRCGIINPAEWRNALISAYKTAYAAVVRPVEGTILTVAREGIEYIRNQIDRSTSFEDLFGMYITEMKKSLANTPKILPQLSDAGVIDSGAKGYIIIMEGMLAYLYGEVLSAESAQPQAAPTNMEYPVDSAVFNENSLFDSGYCVEFTLQLMKNSRYSQRFNLSRYISDLQDYGNSIVAVQDGSRVKVHVHTLKPAKVLSLSQEFGEFFACKIENMQVQHNMLQHQAPKKSSCAFSLISVADSPETEQLFRELGSDCVLRSGGPVALSAEDFLQALHAVNAETAVILPGSAPQLQAALAAREQFSPGEVIVLETRSMAESYSALAMYMPDEAADSALRVAQLRSGTEGVGTLTILPAGNAYGALFGETPLGTGPDALQLFLDALQQVPDIDSKEFCVLLRGLDQPADLEAALQARLAALFPDLEVNFVYGASPLYAWAAALS